MALRLHWLTAALVLLIGVIVAESAAAAAYPISDDMSVIAPARGVAVLEDANQEYQSDQVLSGSLDREFSNRSPDQTSAGITQAQWWLRFAAQNIRSSATTWVMNFPFAIMDEVDIYHVVDGIVVESFELGDKRPKENSNIPGHGISAQMVTPADATSIVYVRILNRYGDNVDTYFEVSSIDAFTQKQSQLFAVYGAVLGGGILLFLYNLIVFLYVRSRVYFWYLCYFASALTAFCFATGFVGQWMETHTSILTEAIPPYVSALTFLLVIQFSRSFLETASTTPRIDIVLRMGMLYFLLPPMIFTFGNGAIAAKTVMIGGLALSALPVFGAWLWYNGHKRARTFTLAWSVWSIAVTILVSRFLGITPTNDFTLNIAWLGILLEAVLFALALAERMLLLSHEKMEAERREKETIRRSKSELETIVVQRTAELRDKNALLADLNRQKDRFFSIIAHDLIGPFNTLIGGSYFLKTNSVKLSPEKIAEYATDLNTASVNLHKLLENLLSWAQLQKGEVICVPSLGDLSASLNGIADLFRPVAEKKNVSIVVETPEQFIAQFDRNIVETIVRNLLNNAVKFSRPGEEITLRLSSLDRTAMISVEDEGIGIAPENLATLLKLDEKLTTPGTAGEKGSGLGLQLCSELSILHGGTLEIESTENEGSTFIFTLPLKLS